MTTKLLILGRQTRPSPYSDHDMNDVAAAASPTDSVLFARCDKPSHLIDIVESVIARHGKLDILDLYDHGNVGHLRMGDDVLFASDDSPATALIGERIAILLGSYLQETAHVRLLGCKTSASVPTGTIPSARAGQLLLLKLARALGGHRTVFGTISSIERADFSTYGFRRELEDQRLFSSWAALDDAPPSSETRGRNIDMNRPILFGASRT